MLRKSLLAIAVATLPFAASADGWGLAPQGTAFQRVTDQQTFLRIVESANLKRFGITLSVEPDGSIDGNAFGRDVSGRWDWQDGYFCRELFWGSTEVGANCQEVAVAGDIVRFRSDRGTGDYADLRLR